jgi:uncharacterized membrane-anchored protein YitT (DUF2179 family)
MLTVDSIMVLILGVILLIGVALPIVNQTVASAGLTGISATLASYFGTFIIIGGLFLVLRATGLIGQG